MSKANVPEQILTAQEGIKTLSVLARDVDAESSRPKLASEKALSNDPLPLKDIPLAIKHASKPEIDQQNLMLIPYLRVPFIAHDFPATNTFYPNSFKMYYIVHLCDDLIRQNFYFKRSCDTWHPLVSRLYFGILFFIQTLRQMQCASLIRPSEMSFLRNFLEMYPPESLPIPGPLLPIFKSMSISTPSNGMYSYVAPTLPTLLGPERADALLIGNNDNSRELLYPAVPSILGFINLILSYANADAVPDFSENTNFSIAHPFTILGHQYGPAWNVNERDSLLRPGMLYSLETDHELDKRFWKYGRRIGFPTINADSNLQSITNYLRLGNPEWFSHVIKIMSLYSRYFKGSSFLHSCSPSGLQSNLVVTAYETRNGAGQLNPHNNLTNAFPNEGVFTLRCTHNSRELSLPQVTSLTGMFSHYDAYLSIPNLNRWSHLNYANTRNGDYWNAVPTWIESTRDDCYLNDEIQISEHFFLERAQILN